MKKNAQAILDYVILILVVIAALLIMQYYIRNSFSGKIREGADAIGEGEIYRPFATGGTTVTRDITENR